MLLLSGRERASPGLNGGAGSQWQTSKSHAEHAQMTGAPRCRSPSSHTLGGGPSELPELDPGKSGISVLLTIACLGASWHPSHHENFYQANIFKTDLSLFTVFFKIS